MTATYSRRSVPERVLDNSERNCRCELCGLFCGQLLIVKTYANMENQNEKKQDELYKPNFKLVGKPIPPFLKGKAREDYFQSTITDKESLENYKKNNRSEWDLFGYLLVVVGLLPGVFLGKVGGDITDEPLLRLVFIILGILILLRHRIKTLFIRGK